MANNTTEIKKSQIAIIQLRQSIRLFNSGDFISALTLAGSANDILGQFALLRHGYNTLDGEKHFWDNIATMTSKPKPAKDKVKKINNRIKNSLKHHDQSADENIKADFEFEAQCHIDSAIRNYWIAFETPLRDRIINKYTNIYW